MFDPEPSRRRALSIGLTAEGYEVVPVVDADEARRFARGLGPAVVVAPAGSRQLGVDVLEDLGPASGLPRTVVLLAGEDEAPADLAEEILWLPVADLSEEEIVARVRLVLVGRELGMEARPRRGFLVGDLAQHPFLELVRRLGRSGVEGTVELLRGRVRVERGSVMVVESGAARGLKAFCRLGRRREGPFRIRLGGPHERRQLDESLSSLVITAIEDSQVRQPPLKARWDVTLGPAFFDRRFDAAEQRLLECAQQGWSFDRILDELPARDGEIASSIGDLESLGVLRSIAEQRRTVVVTDSTADLSEELARENQIDVLPLTVHFGDAVFHDRVDLEPKGFYERLQAGPHHPTTQPVPERDFSARYLEHIRASDLYSIHISGRLSLTASHAEEAAALVRSAVRARRRDGSEPRIEVFDSGQVSLGLALLALAAGRMAARDRPVDEIAAAIREMASRVTTLFVVDTLEYLARGGRIGRAQALVGRLLQIKPILGLAGGEVTPVDRVRGARAALPRITELVAASLEAGRPALVAVAHANAPARGDRLRSMLEERIEVGELVMAEIGPVVGTHVGPGCVGVACLQPTDEEAPWIAPLAGREAG